MDTHTRVFDPTPRRASPVRGALQGSGVSERPKGKWALDAGPTLSLHLRDEPRMNPR
jgi:hypothetical protein